jgi:integrase/recombinase XerD
MTTTLITQINHDQLRMAAAAYLARFKGQSRVHTESELRGYLYWCAERGLDPLAATRPHIELYVRWMQEQRRYAASTVSPRMAVVAGFYRTCVIDGILDHSPAEYVRRPNVPPQSPTLGLSHLQFEAMLTAARLSPNRNDFALVCLLGLLGLRIFEATSLDVSDLGEEHGHRVVRVVGKGHKIVLIPMPPAVARAIDRAVADRQAGPILLNQRGARMDRHAATRRLRRLQKAAGVHIARMHPHMLDTPSSPPCSMPAWIYETRKSPPATLIRAPPCVTTAPETTWTVTPTTSSPPTCPPAPDSTGSVEIRLIG